MDSDGWPMTWRWRVEELACVFDSTYCLFFFSVSRLLFSSFAAIPTAHGLYSYLCKSYAVLEDDVGSPDY